MRERGRLARTVSTRASSRPSRSVDAPALRSTVPVGLAAANPGRWTTVAELDIRHLSPTMIIEGQERDGASGGDFTDINGRASEPH